VERVHGRLKVFWGADDDNIADSRRFHGFAVAVLVVHLGLATVLARLPRWNGLLGKMRADTDCPRTPAVAGGTGLAGTGPDRLSQGVPPTPEFPFRGTRPDTAPSPFSARAPSMPS
jgi:hypothetical protein